MPAEPAPGQAAYEAYRHAPGPTMMPLDADRFEWDCLQPDDRAAWAAAANAVAAPLNAELARLREEAASLREEAASLREEVDRLRIADVDLRGDLDDLASWWENEYVTDDGWPATCARELREALQGGGDGD